MSFVLLVISTILGVIGAFIVTVWTCWGGFVLAMALKRAKKANKLNFWTKLLGYPFTIFFIILDFLFNLTFGSLLFLKWPQDLLFTPRLDRYIRGEGWRKRLSLGICKTLLDSFDPDGDHCNERKF